MAFILGVGRKTARQTHGGFAANFLFFIQPWGIRNDLESIRKCFSFEKIRNLEKNITWDYSRVPQFPVFRSRPEVENMTMHSFRVNSIYPQSFIQIGPRVSEIIQPTPKMNAIIVWVLGILKVFMCVCLLLEYTANLALDIKTLVGIW